MANELDPEDESPAGPQDTQSSDQSKSKLREAWDAWTSRPENNAFLLQTGIALLQPRAPGQSGIGQFANAIGEGSAASERNVASQNAQELQQANIESKRGDTAARQTTANAYADQVRQGAAKRSGVSATLRLQQEFNKWIRQPQDITQDVDPVVAAVQKAGFPDVKTKADLLANPGARAAAFRIFSSNYSPEGEDDSGGTAGGGAAAAPAAAPPGPSGRPVYDKASGALRGYWYPDRGFVPNGQ